MSPRRPPAPRRAVRRRVRLVRLALTFLLLVAVASVIDVLDGPPPAIVMRDAGPPVDLPAPPEPWSGEDAGCTVEDPTVDDADACLTPATAWLVEQSRRTFGEVPLTCWSEHGWNPDSDHPQGRGCDLFYGRAGEFATGTDRDEGWRAAQWLRVNADALDVRYIIWQGRIWQADRPELGWAPYTGGGVYDADDATGGHFDHVHVSVRAQFQSA